jgi:branched-chain amino acid transport system substrate-binding protein
MKASRVLQAIVVVALSFGIQSAADAQTIRLGFMSSLSGPLGSLGPEQRRGLDLALEDLGGKLGGLPVEVLVGDDEGDAKAAVAAASKLIDKDKVDLVTGIIASPAILGAAKTFTDGGTIVISANAGPSPFAGKACNPNFFFTGFQNDQGDEAVGLFLNDHGYKRVFYVGFDNQAGYDHINGAKRTFKGENAGEAYTPQTQLEYSAEIAKIRGAKPDAVFAFYVGAAAVAFVKQYGQSGLKEKLPLFSFALVDPLSVKAQGSAAFGVKVAAPYFPSIDNPQNKKFVAAFVKKYGHEPSFYVADQYDAIMLIDSAIRAVGGKVQDHDAMRAALMKADFTSLRGKFRFNVNHFPIQDFYVASVEKTAGGEAEFKIEGVGIHDGKDSYYQDCKMAQ